MNIESMLHKTVIKIDSDNEELIFHMNTGHVYKFYHSQDCCESVHIDDICGDLNDLLFHPLLVADERVGDYDDGAYYESVTWTFYEFATIKGSVTVRWCGESNGYYSESVDLDITDPPEGFIPQAFLDEGLFNMQ